MNPVALEKIGPFARTFFSTRQIGTEYNAFDLDYLAGWAHARKKRYMVSVWGTAHWRRPKGYLNQKRKDLGFDAFALNPLALEKIGPLGGNFFSTAQIGRESEQDSCAPERTAVSPLGTGG